MEVLQAIMRCAPIWCRMDMWRDLMEVKNLPLQRGKNLFFMSVLLKIAVINKLFSSIRLGYLENRGGIKLFMSVNFITDVECFFF